MKELFAGIVLLLVIGIGGFMYRNEVERPLANTTLPVSGAGGAASTQEAKLCPDGSAVGRTGPNCSFAACPPPNAELTVGSTTLDFVLPAGYQKTTDVSSGSLIATYQQSVTNGSIIKIFEYPLPTGQGPSQVMLANTAYVPSGVQATSTTAFTQVTEGKNVFSEVQIGRSQGQVQTAYYLAQPNDVLRFDIIETNVTDWNDPSLNPSTLPQHQALEQMLATLEVTS
jgi:hypothetical protein